MLVFESSAQHACVPLQMRCGSTTESRITQIQDVDFQYRSGSKPYTSKKATIAAFTDRHHCVVKPFRELLCVNDHALRPDNDTDTDISNVWET